MSGEDALEPAAREASPPGTSKSQKAPSRQVDRADLGIRRSTKPGLPRDFPGRIPFQPESDQLFPDATAEPVFRDAEAAEEIVTAVAKTDGVSRATFWAFPLEAMPIADRQKALADFLEWCEGDPILSVSRRGSGSGTVTSSTAGIDCGSDCFEQYPRRTQVTLTATPAAGSRFEGWSGGGCGGTGACVLDLDDNAPVVATFDVDLPEVTLQVSRDGNGAGTVSSVPAGIDCGADCSGRYSEGTEVTLTATPAAGSTFAGWSGGGCGGTGPCPLTLNANTLVTATFDFVPPTDCPGALCLNGERFRVDVAWRTPQGTTGSATAAPGIVSDDSGVLYFFSPDNWEMLIKVLNGCTINGRYWVFFAATTDVGFRLEVTDTETGEVQQYTNQIGQAAQAITDTTAFATCP